MCLPVLPAPAPDLRMNPISGDTSFCFVVDSVRLRQYDTEHLRTFYTRSLTQAGGSSPLMAYPSYTWANHLPRSPTRGIYTEWIIGDFFPDQIMNCVDCYSFKYAPYGTLRCYSDGTYNLKLQPEACDTLYPLGINTLQSARNILKLYPNPVADRFTIVPDKPLNDDLSIMVTDVSGRVMVLTTLLRKEQRKTIFTQAWAAGLYLQKFRAGDQVYYDKIIVSRK